MRGRALAIVGFGWAATAGAQDLRITGTSWFQSIDLRPLRRDSVLASATTGTGEVRRTADGQRVVCVTGDLWCGFLASGARTTTRPFLQDVGLAAWGLGEGISVHAHARVRDALGNGAVSWPRANDRFDLLDAYVEMDRPAWRARLGRQWMLGGLGAYNYDGAAVTLRRGGVDGDVSAGRALVQGLNEPYTSAEIGAVDDLPPETAAWLVGGRVRVRSGPSAVTATYLRVVQDDRSGLYAERASLDASTRLAGLRLSGSLAHDLASNVVNEAQLRVARDVGRGIDVSLEGRRHRPFFELWTIWGAFAPVGFDEGRASVSVRAGERLSLATSGAWRQYDETTVGLQAIPLRTDGWRASVDASWLASDRVSARASYGVDIGFGSSQGDGNVGVEWRGERWEAGAAASVLQTIYEFRVGTGRIYGMSASGGYRLTSEVRARADGGVYRHRLTNDAPGTDWSQRRVSLRLEWAVGGDAGATR